MRRQAKCYNLITRMLSGHCARGDVGGDVGGEVGGDVGLGGERLFNSVENTSSVMSQV